MARKFNKLLASREMRNFHFLNGKYYSKLFSWKWLIFGLLDFLNFLAHYDMYYFWSCWAYIVDNFYQNMAQMLGCERRKTL